MRSVRQTAHSALAALVLAGSLGGPHPAWAQRGAPPIVVDEMRRVHADFSTGGTGRLNANWGACVKRATAGGDADLAERCLIYTFGALLLDDSDTSHRGQTPMSGLTPDNVAAANNRLLDVMGVPPNGRKAALDRYKKWVFERHMADMSDGTPRGGWGGVLSDMGRLGGRPGERPVERSVERPMERPGPTPSRPNVPGQAMIDPSTLFPSPSSPSLKNSVTPRPALSFGQPAERPPVAPVPAPSPSNSRVSAPGEASEIPLQKRGGTFVVPVLLNNAVSLKFTIDSGASDVSISADVLEMLKRSGTLDRSDMIGKQTYRLADGSRVTNDTFRIRVLKVGDKEVRDVVGSVSNGDGSLLLGQSFLTRFQSWSIDNQRQVLVLR